MMISVSEAVFEVTRRCNGGFCDGNGVLQPCEHCLRGRPQNITMKSEIIEAIAGQLHSVSEIVFSGGEPTLVPRVLRKIANAIRGYDSFYIVTNGIVYSPSTVEILNSIYRNTPYLDKDITALSVSVDPFHPFKQDVYNRYADLEYFRKDKEYDFHDARSIINDGMARENGIGGREISPPYLEFDFCDDNLYITSPLYFNAKGDVIPGCNYSYESQEKYKMGNILEEPLEDMVLSFIRQNCKSVYGDIALLEAYLADVA